MIVAIEGLPGSGKTTSAGLIAERLGVRALLETTHDHPFINRIYDDEQRYDLEVELAFVLLHNAGYRRLDPEAVTVTDFSPRKDLLFAEDMLDGADLEAFAIIYERLYSGLSMPDVVLYLDVAPELCMERIERRRRRDPSRAFEAGLGLDRLKRMDALYQQHLNELGCDVLKIPVRETDTRERVADAARTLLESRTYVDLAS